MNRQNCETPNLNSVFIYVLSEIYVKNGDIEVCMTVQVRTRWRRRINSKGGSPKLIGFKIDMGNVTLSLLFK